ncbi:conserved hypothetical protein [Vibrio crassostreae]|uniref:hypothetical protein n=2 Tax=Vibrio TaxID=662 RepID=UPI000631FB3F|nr:hypothetical protein [Vibrio lentus]PMJ09221.1 hypothetical protein BCU31_18685 [Vibrio lentus]CAK2951009.1 conserved hypothetical protein [Vibrio crassostreae]CAK3895579.1 conserved hypothetical protein [Vibrio crassostreae]CDT47151.1 hypothetical protein VCR15J5_620035 [Vibrio crassostreae]
MTMNTEKLNVLKSRLKPGIFEVVLRRINSLYKVASKVPFLDIPGLGVITGMDFISTSIDEILNELDAIDDDQYKSTVLQLLDDHEVRLIKLQKKVTELIPVASVTLNNPNNAVLNLGLSHGVSSVTDNGVNNFTINFLSPLRTPEMYFPHCNVPTKYINVNRHRIDVIFEDNVPLNKEVKIYLAWMGSSPPN